MISGTSTCSISPCRGCIVQTARLRSFAATVHQPQMPTFGAGFPRQAPQRTPCTCNRRPSIFGFRESVPRVFERSRSRCTWMVSDTILKRSSSMSMWDQCGSGRLTEAGWTSRVTTKKRMESRVPPTRSRPAAVWVQEIARDSRIHFHGSSPRRRAINSRSRSGAAVCRSAVSPLAGFFLVGWMARSAGSQQIDCFNI